MRWQWVLAVCAVGLVACADDGAPSENVDESNATIKLSTPTVEVVGETTSSILVKVCAGPTGAKGGFSLQWTTADTSAGWPSGAELCKGSYSGLANASRFALAPGACAIVDVGRQLPEPGATVSCGELACGTPLQFRAFVHAYNESSSTYARSDVSAKLAAATQACAARVDDVLPADVANALAALPSAEVLESTPDGVPRRIAGDLARVGDLGAVDAATAETRLRAVLPAVAAPFRLQEPDLLLRKLNVDEDDNHHFRFRQVHAGLDVIGGDLIVHTDRKGVVFGVNGTARGDLPPATPLITDGTAISIVAQDPRFFSVQPQSARLVYIQLEDGSRHLAFEIVAAGERGSDPALDDVYVDAHSSQLIAIYPQLHFARHRAIYTAGNRTSLPGTLMRTEGSAPATDIDVNAAYDNTGDAYNAFQMFFMRDSYDGSGASLISSVHYSSNYCQAYWDSSKRQMVYGDGLGETSNCRPLARAVDVTAHELAHAVTADESNLIYSGEPGGINESLSDIFGAFTEAWVDGGRTGTLAVTADTWKIGEDVLPPALRYMCDPAADRMSRDYWTSTVGNYDVHYSSGVGNLAFCLLVNGGTHPRGKSTVQVAGIGMAKAIRIFYRAQTTQLTSTSNYLTARNATIDAAISLGYDQSIRDSVQNAWAAVGVGIPVGGLTDEPTDGVLTNNVSTTGLGGSAGSSQYYKLVVPPGFVSNVSFTITGGTGDADLYVKYGTRPTLTDFDCRPYLNGNVESCTMNNPQAGTYYVMLRGYMSFGSVSLTGSYSVTDEIPWLSYGDPVMNLGGTAGSVRYFKMSQAAFFGLTIQISGGNGDADLYVRSGAKPTLSSYDCRPYLYGNAETCEVPMRFSSNVVYIMLRGYESYLDLSLVGY